MNDNFEYDAIIKVVSKYIVVKGGKIPNEEINSTLAEVGMGYASTHEGISETSFRQRVFTVAKSLEKAYEFWPDGEVSVNATFITNYVNA